MLERLLALPQCGATLLRGHGGTRDEIPCAVANLGVDESWVNAAVAINSGIYDPQLQALESRQHADGGAASQKVLDHLPRDGARIGAHAPIAHAMVGCEDNRHRAHDARLKSPLNRAHLCGEGLQPTE